MKKSSLILGLVTAIATVSFATVTLAQSASSPPGSSLAAKIAQAFNLNQTDVQKVITDYRGQQQDTRLQKLVDNGKITAAQKTLIENKQKELQPRLDQIRAMTDPTARRTAMNQLRTEIQQWEKDNKITLPLFRSLGGHRGGRMMDNN